jgi:hypothetical protein
MGSRVVYWAERGAFWGSLGGLLVGVGFFWAPGVGPLLIAGPLVGIVIAAMEGAAVVGTLSALGAILVGVGIADDEIDAYEAAIRTGKYLLIYHGSAEDIEKTRQVLDQAKATETKVFPKALAGTN